MGHRVRKVEATITSESRSKGRVIMNLKVFIKVAVPTILQIEPISHEDNNTRGNTNTQSLRPSHTQVLLVWPLMKKLAKRKVASINSTTYEETANPSHSSANRPEKKSRDAQDCTRTCGTWRKGEGRDIIPTPRKEKTQGRKKGTKENPYAPKSSAQLRDPSPVPSVLRQSMQKGD